MIAIDVAKNLNMQWIKPLPNKDKNKNMNEKKIIDYVVVSNESDEKTLSKAVKEMLENGWHPLGGLSVTYDSHNQDFDLWQAMVKYEQ